MEQTHPMGSLIGFDPAGAGRATPSSHPMRRASDREFLAEVYDLQAFSASGDRAASRRPELEAPPLDLVGGRAHPDAVHASDGHAAAERLYAHLTASAGWLRVSDEGEGRLTMLVHDENGEPIRRVSVTELGWDDGPDVA